MKRILSNTVLIFILILIPFLIIYHFKGMRYVKDFQYFFKTGYKFVLPSKTVKVPEDYSSADKNNNKVPDPIDLVNEARKEAIKKTPYKDAYYATGYPPDTEGVCTDVIWRAFKGINVSIKDLIDDDIKNNTSQYSRVEGKPDPNIDFRRVPNLNTFFKRHAESLTTEIKPGNIENLRQWQPGDIVVILKPYQHIGIISDKRSSDGVPYFIHNSYPHAAEISHFSNGNFEIAGHYRWRY